MNRIDMSIGLIKDFSSELLKFFLALCIGWSIYQYMKNKYGTTTISNTIMLMFMLMTLTDGNMNYWIVTFFVMLASYYYIFTLVDISEQQSKTKNLEDSESDYPKNMSFDPDNKSEYIQYLIKSRNMPYKLAIKCTNSLSKYVKCLVEEHHMPKKIAIKYTNYSLKNLETKVSLVSLIKKNKKFYFAKSVNNDLVTLIYIGGVLIKIEDSVKKDDNVEDIKKEEGNDIKKDEEDIKKEERNDIKKDEEEKYDNVEDIKKEEIENDKKINNNIQNIEAQITPKNYDAFRAILGEMLLDNTDEKIVGQVMEICKYLCEQ
jgi:Ca2+/Na+ antiporter